MGSTGGEEGLSAYEAHIPSSNIEDFQGVTGRISAIRKIQDLEERRRKLEELLRSAKVKGAETNLSGEVFEQIARSGNEQPTKAEQDFARESRYAASRVAKNLEDLHTSAFEGLIVKTDGNGDVTNIQVKKILPEEDARKARNQRGLQNLPNAPATSSVIHVDPTKVTPKTHIR